MLRKITIRTLLTFVLTGTAHAALRTQEPAQIDWREALSVDWRKAFKVAQGEAEYAMLNEFLTQNHFPTLDQDARAIHARNRYDCLTPLHVATEKGNSVVAALLIKRGADINAGDCWRGISHGNWTPLHLASYGDNKSKMAALLLAHGADVNTRDVDGQTPLHVVVDFGKSEVAALLLAHGADVNAKDYCCGSTPLHLACRYNKSDMAALLIVHGADINARDHDGQTPLHHAVNEENTEVVALLRVHGADVTIKNCYGRTPLQYAVTTHNSAIIFLCSVQDDWAQFDTTVARAHK